MKKTIIIILIVSILTLAILIKFEVVRIKIKRHAIIGAVVKYFPFSNDSALKEWDEKVLKGKVQYTIEKDDSVDPYVLAESSKSASALYYKIELDITKHPVISWKWRVLTFPKKEFAEKINQKKEEDFAARIYVIFPAAFFTNSKVIEYIWAEHLPVGHIGKSAYSKNIKVMVLRSGMGDDKWVSEERDIFKDYVALFGEEPRKDVGAISFMTDSDSTKSSASSMYDEIKVGYKGSEVRNAL